MANTPPGKTWTPGLEWTENVYVDWTKHAEADIKRAHEIIKEKLPLMDQLDGVISLTFGDQPPIFLDSRSSEAKLVDEFDGEPTTTLNMKPECKFAQAFDNMLPLEPRPTD